MRRRAIKVRPSRRWVAVCLNSLTNIDRRPQYFSSHTRFLLRRVAARKYAEDFMNGFVAEVKEGYSHGR